jgi:hypothetical protein
VAAVGGYPEIALAGKLHWSHHQLVHDPVAGRHAAQAAANRQLLLERRDRALDRDLSISLGPDEKTGSQLRHGRAQDIDRFPLQHIDPREERNDGSCGVHCE